MIKSVVDFAIFIFMILNGIVYVAIFFIIKKERSVSRIMGFLALCLLALLVALDAFG